jgi:hypothetical protein
MWVGPPRASGLGEGVGSLTDLQMQGVEQTAAVPERSAALLIGFGLTGLSWAGPSRS